MTNRVPTSLAARLAQLFFMHLGTLVAVVVYFVVGGRGGFSLDAVATALWTALIVQTGYAALAWWQGEHKQLDVGVWLLFAVGAAAAAAHVGPVLHLYQVYSGALLFGAFGLTALIPLLLGREPFTAYFARRQLPRWQIGLPETDAVTRWVAAWWVLVFFAAAALCAWAPLDWRFTLLLPNLLVLLVGMPAPAWIAPLYFRLHTPRPPERIEPFLMSMPFVFDPRAAGGARANVQFRVSGDDGGAWWIRVADGRCQSFEGTTPEPHLTVDTPDHVWLRIARGELDGGSALMNGLYRVEGDATILARLPQWFPARR
jgi:hypothetical protein